MSTRRTVTLASLAVVGILVVALLSNRRLAPQEPPSSEPRAASDGRIVLDEGRATAPFVFVYISPKYPLPGEDVIGGLKVAVWQDGHVVRARSASEVGKAYIQGRLKPEQLDALIRSIERVGILATPTDESSPLHAACDILKVRTRSGLRAWAHSVPNKENALVEQIEEMLMQVDIPNAESRQWEARYPSEWDG